MNSRFTLDGSESLEKRLEDLCTKACEKVRESIPSRLLHAILLGGGYGRGEGGVLATAEGQQPYNDLEFYVLLGGPGLLNQRRFSHPVHRAAEDLTALAGIDVEFKLLPLRKLERSPV